MFFFIELLAFNIDPFLPTVILLSNAIPALAVFTTVQNHLPKPPPK